MDRIFWFNRFRFCLAQAGHDKIGQARDNQNNEKKIQKLPDQMVHIEIDEPTANQKRPNLDALNFPVQLLNPGERGLQAGIESWDKNQGKERAQAQSPNHGNGKRRADCGYIFGFYHG